MDKKFRYYKSDVKKEGLDDFGGFIGMKS